MNYAIDDFTPSGNLSYINEHGEILHQTLLKEIFNLRWYIPHLMDENEDQAEDSLSQQNWTKQTNWKFIKYVNDERKSPTQSSEYIIIFEDGSYIVSTTPEEILHILKDKYEINIYLQDKYPHGPGERDICQCHIKLYLEKLYVNVNMLFNDKLPTDLHISFQIIKLLIKKGNLNLIHNKNTYVHFN